MVTILLFASMPAFADEATASAAVLAFDNYREAVASADACLNRSDSKIFTRLSDREEAATARLFRRYPALQSVPRGGDTDYYCKRTRAPYVSRALIRREAERLIAQIETEAAN